MHELATVQTEVSVQDQARYDRHLPEMVSKIKAELAPKRDHRLNSLGQIITASEQKGSQCRYWFSKDTLRFFSSRISEMVYPTFGEYGTVFVSSERDGNQPRWYTVRRAYWQKNDEGIDVLHIESISEFQAYASRNGAHAMAKRVCDAHKVA